MVRLALHSVLPSILIETQKGSLDHIFLSGVVIRHNVRKCYPLNLRERHGRSPTVAIRVGVFIDQYRETPVPTKCGQVVVRVDSRGVVLI